MHILIASFIATLAAAEPTGISARRAPRAPFQPYLEASRQLSREAGAPFGKMTRATAATEQAINYVAGVALRPAPAWDSEEDVIRRFRLIRDARVLHAEDRPDFPRRATWLYPDDGCYARAALAVRTLIAAEPDAKPPGKIFAFGNLSVHTGNAPGGRVDWWYHVAPVVRVGQRSLVLDPSIEPSRPLSVEEWLVRQTTTPESTMVAICGSGTYVPSDRCDLQSDGLESIAVEDERDLLGPEWARVKELGREPEMELGDKPPWP